MFPRGTRELGLPEGMRRLETPRGVFHFNPELITEEEILRVSAEERENEILELGPFSKREILARVERGERLMLISEYTMKGVEVRSAVGTEKTIEEQHSYFERTKGEEGFIVMGVVPERVMKGLKEIENG